MFTVKIQNEDKTVTSLFSYQNVLFIGPSEDLERQKEFECAFQESQDDEFDAELLKSCWGRVSDMSTDQQYWLVNGDSLYVTDMSGKTVLMEKCFISVQEQEATVESVEIEA